MRKPAPIRSDSPASDEYEGPSKSALKRQMTALQKIGKTLAEMPFDKVKRSPASEKLLESIREYQRIRSHEGKRRQLQYIGKVMRDEDGETLAQWIAGESLDQRLEVTRMHAAEAWRDRLIAEPSLLAEFIRHYPAALNADLHTLIRNARAEKEKNKPPKSARELYQLIKGWVSQTPGSLGGNPSAEASSGASDAADTPGLQIDVDGDFDADSHADSHADSDDDWVGDFEEGSQSDPGLQSGSSQDETATRSGRASTGRRHGKR